MPWNNGLDLQIRRSAVIPVYGGINPFIFQAESGGVCFVDEAMDSLFCCDGELMNCTKRNATQFLV